MYCDFSTVTDILFDHLSGTSIGNYTGIIEVLFSSYLKKPDNSLEKQEVSKYRNRKRKLPTNLVEHYIKTDKQELLSDISVLLTYQFDRADLHKSLFLLMCNDEYLSIEYRRRIKREYSSTYSDDKALSELIYEAVYTAVARPYTLENGLYYVRSYFNADLLEASDTLFINAKPLEPCKFFCGRDEELEELHKKVRKKSKVVVTGVIGVGKSELARAYAKKYASDYKQVIYCMLTNDTYNPILSMIADLNTDYIDEAASKDDNERYNTNLKIISSLGKDALLIFDNYNVIESDDEQLPDILNLDCDVLFTSRFHYDDIAAYHLKTFKKYDYAYELLQHYYPFDESDLIESTMHRLVSVTKGHPFALDLCGRQLKKGLQTPGSLEDILLHNNSKKLNARISAKKDGAFLKGTYDQLLYSIYYGTDFSEDELHVLSYMRFAPETGMSKLLFAFLIDIDDINVIEDLIERGFIHEFENGTIALPSIMREIVKTELNIQPEDFVPFFKNLLSCDNKDASTVVLAEIMAKCTYGWLLEMYDSNMVMAVHTVIQFFHKIDAITNEYFNTTFLWLIIDKNNPEELAIYQSDKNNLLSAIHDTEFRNHIKSEFDYDEKCYYEQIPRPSFAIHIIPPELEELFDNSDLSTI